MPKRGRSRQSSFTKRAKFTKRGRGTRKRNFYRKKKFNPGSRRASVKGFPRISSVQKWEGITFPETLYKKMGWEYQPTFAPANPLGSNASAFYVIRLTSPYDPDYSFGGYSANNYSSFMNAQLYKKYQTMGTKVELTMTNPSSEMITMYPFICDGNDLPNYAQSFAQPQLDQLALTASAHKPVFIGTRDSGNSIKKATFYVKPWMIHGYTREQYVANVDCWGGVNSSPNNNVYLVLNAICTLPNTGAYMVTETSTTFYTRMFDNSNANTLLTGLASGAESGEIVS